MIIAAFSICLTSGDSTISTTSNRPKVAKLCSHLTSGHSFLILADTSSASILKSLGSWKASGESRLSIAYTATDTPPVAVLTRKSGSNRPARFSSSWLLTCKLNGGGRHDYFPAHPVSRGFFQAGSRGGSIRQGEGGALPLRGHPTARGRVFSPRVWDSGRDCS